MEQQLQSFRQILKDNNVDALLIASPNNIAYLTNYFGFSLIEKEAYVVITKKSQYLFTDGRYTHEAAQVCKQMTLLETTYDKPFSSHLTDIVKKEKITKLGIEPTVLTIAEYKKSKLKNLKLIPVSLRNVRLQKSPQEIANIKKACDIGDKTFSFITKQIKLGMTEVEVANLMEEYIRKQGASLSFATIVAFGKNAAIPHHHTDSTKLKKGDEILLDFGVKHNNYCSDMTRTVYFQTVNTKQKTIYQTVKAAQEKAADFIATKLKEKTVIKLSDADKTARDHILSQGYPSIPHGLGHGIGLEVHESPSLSPRSEDVLEEGMVFSIEPGIYNPQEGGVRIEDLFSIKDNKLIRLTNSSRDLTIL